MQNLKEYLEKLKQENELAVVSTTVDPILEVAQIHRKTIEENGPALLFTNIKGAKYPLATNLFGNKKRIELAFGQRPLTTIKNLINIAKKITETKPTISDLFSTALLLAKTGTKNKRYGYVTQNLIKPNLSQFPLIKTWQEDGGEFFTLPLVLTKDISSNNTNLGMYRLQRFSDNSTGFHCQIGKGAGYHLQVAKENKTTLPVNTFIGGPPLLTLSAIAPLPENMPEIIFASLLMNQKIPMITLPENPLPILANAEFALIGEVDPFTLKPEGPFGDHYGYYSLQHPYPVYSIKKIYHTNNPICTATVVGKPIQEDHFLGDYLQDLLLPIIPFVMPNVKNLWSYGEAGYHSLATAVVKERYRREAMAAAFRILGEGQLSLTKFLIVINKNINIRSFKEVLEYVLERFHPSKDLFIINNLSMDTLDYTSGKVNKGSKAILLGVREKTRSLPYKIPSNMPPQVRSASIFCRGCLLITINEYGDKSPNDIDEIKNHNAFQEWPLVVVVDNAKITAYNQLNFLYTVFTRLNPASDISSAKEIIQKNTIERSFPIFFDCRFKPWYPKELECDIKTKKLVEERWPEYNIHL